jgi:hypothetical protein
MAPPTAKHLESFLGETKTWASEDMTGGLTGMCELAWPGKAEHGEG